MVSERRACRVLSQPRMTQRYEATRPDDEERLVARMRGLVLGHVSGWGNVSQGWFLLLAG